MADVWIYAFLPIYLHVHLEESRLWIVSLVLTAPAVVRWVMAPIWGRAADRSLRPRRLLAVGLLGYGALLLGMATVKQPVALIALVAGTIAFGSAFNPVGRALVSLHNPGRSLLDLAAWHQWEAGGYLLSGLVVGAALDNRVFFKWWTTGTATVLALCAVILLMGQGVRGAGRGWPAEGRDVGRPQPPVRRLPWTDWKPVLRGALLFLFVAAFVWEAMAGVFGLYFTQIVGGSATAYGLVISAATGLSLFVYRPLARYGMHAPTTHLFRLASVSATAMYGLMTVAAPWSAAVSYMIPFTSIVRTAFNALLVGEVAPRRRGEFLGVMEAAESSAAVVGPLAGGLAADRFGLAALPFLALVVSLSLYFPVTPRSKPRIT